MAPEILSEHACFGGVQGFYRHPSVEIGLPMKFGVFTPPQAIEAGRPVPLLFYLAGLTCSEETFAVKASPQRVAAKLGLMLLTPDTSPRATGIAGACSDWDFGEGAGFYLDASRAPWSLNWRMESYLTQELRALMLSQFPACSDRIGLMGHSMGGHGALTLALRNPHLFQSVSAIAPIAAPMKCPWGRKAFSAYLGKDRKAWAAHDACELLRAGARLPPRLVDQGLADKLLTQQHKPELLEEACREMGQVLSLRRHTGYDHGYYFVASVIEDHLKHHARHLLA